MKTNIIPQINLAFQENARHLREAVAQTRLQSAEAVTASANSDGSSKSFFLQAQDFLERSKAEKQRSLDYFVLADQLNAQADYLASLADDFDMKSSEDYRFGGDIANTKAVPDPIPDSVATDEREGTIDDGAPIPKFLTKKKED